MASDHVSGIPTLDQLLTFLATFVVDRFKHTGLGTHGALLADEIRAKFPGFSNLGLLYEQCGITKLSEAVAIAESKGLLHRDWSVKHLQVLPPDTRPTHKDEQRAPDRAPHIRPDIWRAFAFVGQSVPSFFDRQTNQVLLETNLANCQDINRHVQIKPISIDDQRRWMAEFLGSKQIGIQGAPISDTFCLTKFPVWLSEQDSALDRDWKRFRTLRVADWVREWATDHGIASEQFFEVAKPRSETHIPSQRTGDERVIREAIIAAVRDLPLEQLENISIPVRYLLRAIQRC